MLLRSMIAVDIILLILMGTLFAYILLYAVVSITKMIIRTILNKE